MKAVNKKQKQTINGIALNREDVLLFMKWCLGLMHILNTLEPFFKLSSDNQRLHVNCEAW